MAFKRDADDGRRTTLTLRGGLHYTLQPYIVGRVGKPIWTLQDRVAQQINRTKSKATVQALFVHPPQNLPFWLSLPSPLSACRPSQKRAHDEQAPFGRVRLTDEDNLEGSGDPPVLTVLNDTQRGPGPAVIFTYSRTMVVWYHNSTL